MSESHNGRGALAAGGLSAILASTCCLGPLVLVSLGFSGAWIGNLTVLEPYRPLFIGAALVALFLAWRRIFRPAHACRPGEVCAVPRVRTAYKLIFWIVAALVSWGVALFEYLFQVPANRIGYTAFEVAQLKILQEVITLSVFVPFAVFYLRQPLRLDYLWAALCLLGAVYFVFRGQPAAS